tara:strand:+ start:3675 stop:4238 length:564 start_codon:yes stop_codon:yes gene_type:complete
MLSYEDLYELLRKEKYSEAMQVLPKKFVEDFSVYISELKERSSSGDDLFADSLAKVKKQMENSIAIFKELMLRRKKKLLQLVFVAAETGIMKRDYENMLVHEREVFDKLVKAVEEGDKALNKILSGSKEKGEENSLRMIMFNQDVEEFVGMDGGVVGPYASGELANLDLKVADILVSGGKATFVDEE